MTITGRVLGETSTTAAPARKTFGPDGPGPSAPASTDARHERLKRLAQTISRILMASPSLVGITEFDIRRVDGDDDGDAYRAREAGARQAGGGSAHCRRGGARSLFTFSPREKVPRRGG